jgi:carbon monoxide dehydrogenase subunit G
MVKGSMKGNTSASVRNANIFRPGDRQTFQASGPDQANLHAVLLAIGTAKLKLRLLRGSLDEVRGVLARLSAGVSQ